jgi:L-threonylcarbamoyladenylate synthase
MAAWHAKAEEFRRPRFGANSLKTEVITVDPAGPDALSIRRAADVIRGGGLVAFPTETVYGLGANALDAAAVGRIFEAKGRPPTNPVIVHLSEPFPLREGGWGVSFFNPEQVRRVATEWPRAAAALAERFWPGPLTLVVPKRAEVPDIVTAGGPTVAVRCPAHPVARMLLREAGTPIAAPSANRSTELSPTRAEHVLKGLNGRIDLVLDGGPCPGGIESTVVDVTGGCVRVLRPGLITAAMLEEVVGSVQSDAGPDRPDLPARAPGQMARHYAPRTPLRLVDPHDLLEDTVQACRAGLKIGSVRFLWESGATADIASAKEQLFDLPADPESAAARLYDVLHELDEAGLDLILVEWPPDGPEWAAIRDRLVRAAQK